ncbi:hypothetical protein AGMMS50267_16060 [Spirochaetia bacterium]|nr:hypothetical protein AGMMS50267_16060 [Spirochaetia bacterium]
MKTKWVEKEIGNNMYRGETQYVDEPISNTINVSINDFYNMMHLIRNSWTTKDYELKMNNAAGYGYIYGTRKFLAQLREYLFGCFKVKCLPRTFVE